LLAILGPYVYNISCLLGTRTYPKLKKVDDVLGGAAACNNVDSTEERCPGCFHART
jgi:DNA-directed RNA polymerase III subunit RPC11